MSHGFEMAPRSAEPLSSIAVIAALQRMMRGLNRGAVFISMVAIIAACCILSYSVFARYFFHIPTDWQDEVSVFLLVGATFFCGAFVQAERGHVGIEALSSLLPASVNRARLLLIDIISFLYCAFFSWKSWHMLHEAYIEGHTTLSSWGPPLWLPYGLMSIGMTVLSLQILLQLLGRLGQRANA